MEKIPGEEFDKLFLHGQGRSSPVYNAILSLKINEALVVKKTEWKRKDSPLSMAHKIERKYGMKFVAGALVDRSGWSIKRVK